MTAHNMLALHILKSLDIAILRRVGPGQYALFGEIPSFYPDLFPSTDAGLCTAPWEHSPMLEFFLNDAEYFFEKQQSGVISSGVWQEDGKVDGNMALFATATTFGDEQAITIRMLREDYTSRAIMIRKAREHLLAQREMSQDLEKFKEKSQVDGLTKVYNRGTFTEFLQSEIIQSMQREYPLSLLILDVDNFKQVNDAYGHVIGDHVLQHLGEILKKAMRRNDIVARYGGEEFVVLISGVASAQAHKIGEKVRASVEAFTYPDTPSFTVSIGCTSYTAGESAEKFIQRADLALYDAKRDGKNTVCVR